MDIKLGNILSNEQLDNKSDIINYYSNYNEIRDNMLPTLIIGWNLTKKLFEDKLKNLTILNKKLKTNLFWTFSKEEKQIDYDKDLKKFIKLLPFDYINHLKYKPFDPIINKLYSIEEIINYIFYSSTRVKRNITSYYCYNKDMIYFFYVNTILGFTFESVDFLQINEEKLLNEIKNNSQLFISEENNKELIDSFKKYFDKLDNFPMYVPYLVNKFK